MPNTDQPSFPILVCANGSSPCNTSVPGLNQSGGGAHVQNSNGYDVGFFTNSGCTIKVAAWEVETYVSSTGEIEAWVNNGTLSHTSDSVFYMCYGDGTISTFQGGTAGSAWDSNFIGVWHLPNGSTLTANDSTSNGNNASALNGSIAAGGQVDGAASMNGTSNWISTPNSISLNIVNTLTISAWINVPSITSGYVEFVRKGLPYYLLATANNVVWLATNDNYNDGGAGAGVALSTGWHYYAGTVSIGVNTIIYKDGASGYSHNSNTSLPISGDPLTFGSVEGGGTQFLNGQIDEVRISNSVRSADWIATEYNNQSSPSAFVTIGAETSPSAGNAFWLGEI